MIKREIIYPVQRKIKSLWEASWDCQVSKEGDRYGWVLWSYENLGAKVVVRSAVNLSSQGNAKKNLQLFLKKNRIKSEPYGLLVKRVPLQNTDRYAIVDKRHYDIVMKYRWIVDSNGYAQSSAGQTILMHRLILRLGKSPLSVDHINRKKLDNRKSNLRIANASQNQANKLAQVNSRSGYKGVHKKGNKWAAQIDCNKKRYHLGYFLNPHSAAKAYNKKARELFGNFASLNKIKIPGMRRVAQT